MSNKYHDILNNQIFLTNAKNNNLSVLSMKDILKTDMTCVSLCLEKKDLPIWRHIKHTNIKNVSDFAVLVGNEHGKQLKHISFYDFMQNLSFFAKNPYISNNMVTVDENINIVQQFCVLPLTNGGVDFAVKFSSSLNSENLSKHKNSSYLIVTSCAIGTTVQLSTEDKILFFNDNGRSKTYNITQKEHILKINDFIDGDFLKLQSEKIMYIYQIPIKQVKNKILSDYKKFDTTLLQNYNITSNLTPGIIKDIFIGTNASCIQRNELMPIICTVQHYDVSSSDFLNVMSINYVSSILSSANSQKNIFLADNKSNKTDNEKLDIDDFFEIEKNFKNNSGNIQPCKTSSIIDDLAGLF